MSNFIGIREDGKLFNLSMVQTEMRGDLSDYLQKEAAKTEIVAKIDNGFYISSKSGKQKVAKILTELNFNTYFTIDEESRNCTMAWIPGPENIQSTLTAKMPKDMILVIMRNSDEEMYLIALSMKDGNIYKLPLTNLYAEGKMCMGNSYSRSGASATEAFNKGVECFNETPWNADLSDQSTERDRRAMWQWDLDTDPSEFIAMPEDWEKHCKMISDDAYNELAKQILKGEGYVPPVSEAAEEVAGDGWHTW